MIPHSGSSSSSLDSGSHSNSRSSSEEDFELDSRENGAITPPKMNHDGYPDSPFLEEESRRALLGGERSERHRKRKSTWTQVFDLILQTAPPLLLTTVGLLATGELLEHVSHWKAMKRVDELIIVIPVILNLKGNLEMNLSSRLGTSANTGQLDDWSTARQIIIGNLALLQVQATIVSFIAACVSFVLGLILPRPQVPSTADNSMETARQAIEILLRSHGHHPKLPPADGRPKSGLIEFVMVASTSMTSACLSSLLLGAFMCGLVIVCRRHKVNPDNVAPPIASCLGDLVTLCLLAVVSAGLIDYVNTLLPLVFIIVCLVTCGFCVYFTRRNEFVSELITKGWSPLIGAMIISSATGTVLDLFVGRYDGFAVLAILSSGLPGAVGSIFVSRLSTEMHAGSHDLPNTLSHHHPHPSLEKITPSTRIVLYTLMIASIPISILFIIVLHVFDWLTLPFVFIAFFTLFFGLAVYLSLLIARSLTHFLWSKELDPDLYAMPIHSSTVDFLGQLLLVLCYEFVSILGVKTHS